jgi:hypothetical protein
MRADDYRACGPCPGPRAGRSTRTLDGTLEMNAIITRQGLAAIFTILASIAFLGVFAYLFAGPNSGLPLPPFRPVYFLGAVLLWVAIGARVIPRHPILWQLPFAAGVTATVIFAIALAFDWPLTLTKVPVAIGLIVIGSLLGVLMRRLHSGNRD